MRLVKVKTNKTDAMIIAQYGQKENPPLWQPGEDYIWQIAQEMTVDLTMIDIGPAAEQLIKQRTALLN